MIFFLNLILYILFDNSIPSAHLKLDEDAMNIDINDISIELVDCSIVFD